jgi:transcription initiation factor IIE alpha subunit
MDEDPPDAAGDPACWLHFVCPGCGRMREDPTLATCPNCGEPVDQIHDDAAISDDRRRGARIQGEGLIGSP